MQASMNRATVFVTPLCSSLVLHGNTESCSHSSPTPHLGALSHNPWGHRLRLKSPEDVAPRDVCSVGMVGVGWGWTWGFERSFPTQAAL